MEVFKEHVSRLAEGRKVDDFPINDELLISGLKGCPLFFYSLFSGFSGKPGEHVVNRRLLLSRKISGNGSRMKGCGCAPLGSRRIPSRHHYGDRGTTRRPR